MSERKVLNKYYPPDFDPSKIPKSKLPKNRQWNIRIMAPFNMRCGTCGEYIYKGKKFNSRKEDVEDDDYLGLKIFRFYIKCPRCVAEISFKTDPENTDYSLEAGAVRNFEALRTAELMAQREMKELEEEEKNNPMKVLENRTKASRQEMDMLETLEDLRELNSRHAKVDTETMLKVHEAYAQQLARLQDEEDEALVSSIFGKTEQGTIKRIHDDGDADDQEAGSSAAKRPRPAKASDILTQDAVGAVKRDPSTTSGVSQPSIQPIAKPPARPAVWQKSVGGLKKNSLKDLVRKKSSAPSDNSGANLSTSSPATDVQRSTGDAKTRTDDAASDESAQEKKKACSDVTPKPPAGLSLVGAYSDSDETSDDNC